MLTDLDAAPAGCGRRHALRPPHYLVDGRARTIATAARDYGQPPQPAPGIQPPPPPGPPQPVGPPGMLPPPPPGPPPPVGPPGMLPPPPPGPPPPVGPPGTAVVVPGGGGGVTLDDGVVVVAVVVVVVVVLVGPPLPPPPHATAKRSMATPPNSAIAVLASDLIRLSLCSGAGLPVPLMRIRKTSERVWIASLPSAENNIRA